MYVLIALWLNCKVHTVLLHILHLEDQWLFYTFDWVKVLILPAGGGSISSIGPGSRGIWFNPRKTQITDKKMESVMVAEVATVQLQSTAHLSLSKVPNLQNAQKGPCIELPCPYTAEIGSSNLPVTP